MVGSAELPGWFGRLTLQAKVLVTVVVVLLAGSAAYWAYRERYTCGPGLDVIDGQCIGVTDGSYVFDPAFIEVQKKIELENERVRRESSSYVTIAFLNPFTAVSKSATEDLRNQLEGAYTAQYRVNRTPGDHHPQIQLILANEGRDQDQWQPVVDRLVKMTKEDHPLVAVVGMGSSIDQTRQAARKLAEHEIPMVGALINADELDHRHIPGLIRVSTSVQEYVKGLGNYLDSRPHLDSAILVRDSNADTGKDLFTKALITDFEQEIQEKRGLIKHPTQIFLGGQPINAPTGPFGIITPNICAAAAGGLDVILYAGRRGDVGSFLEAMEDRVCRANPLVVMAGTNLQSLLHGWEERLRSANLTVVFPGRTDIEGWKHNVAGTPEHFPEFRKVFEGLGFSPEHVDNRSILTHDAVLTAAQAVRLATLGQSTPSAGVPTAREVRSQLLNLNSLEVVQGASGTLRFSDREQDAGNPQGMQVLVFQVPPPTDGPSWQVGPPYFTSSGP